MKKYIALFLSLALLFGTLALPAEAATDSFTKKTPSVTVKATSYNSAKVSFKKASVFAIISLFIFLPQQCFACFISIRE